MTSPATSLEQRVPEHPLRNVFLKWQCHVRQLTMRQNTGRPDDAIMPDVTLDGETVPMGAIITIMSKAPDHSLLSEIKHMAVKTNDPAQRRSAALAFFSEAYYQKHKQFSDILTSTFATQSPGARKILAAGQCTLAFDAYAQQFKLKCKAYKLAPHHFLHQSTIAHNILFNPCLRPDVDVLAFAPDWENSTCVP